MGTNSRFIRMNNILHIIDGNGLAKQLLGFTGWFKSIYSSILSGKLGRRNSKEANVSADIQHLVAGFNAYRFRKLKLSVS